MSTVKSTGSTQPTPVHAPGSRPAARVPTRAEVEQRLGEVKAELAKLGWASSRSPAQKEQAKALESEQQQLTARLQSLAPATREQVAKLSQRLAEMNTANEDARTKGVLGNKVANLLTGGAVGSAAASRDALVASVNQLHQTHLAKDRGELTAGSLAVLNTAIDGAMDGIRDLKEIRDGTVQTTTSLGTAMALTAAAPFTGGASLAGIGTLGAVGAGAKVGLNASMDGSNYTAGRAAEDAATGFVQGAVQAGTAALGAASLSRAVGSQVATAVTVGSSKVVSSGTAQVIGQTAGRVVAGATNGAVQGGAAGLVGAGVGAGVTASTWDKGVTAGLSHVAEAALEGGKSGAIGGAVMGGVMNVTGRSVEVRIDPKALPQVSVRGSSLVYTPRAGEVEAEILAGAARAAKSTGANVAIPDPLTGHRLKMDPAGALRLEALGADQLTETLAQARTMARSLKQGVTVAHSALGSPDVVMTQDGTLSLRVAAGLSPHEVVERARAVAERLDGFVKRGELSPKVWEGALRVDAPGLGTIEVRTAGPLGDDGPVATMRRAHPAEVEAAKSRPAGKAAPRGKPAEEAAPARATPGATLAPALAALPAREREAVLSATTWTGARRAMEAFPGSKAVALAALTTSEEMVMRLPAALRKDMALLKQAAIANPALVMPELQNPYFQASMRTALPPARVEALLRDPEVKAAVSAMKTTLAGAPGVSPSTFLSRPAMREILDNRLNPGRADPRPTAVVVYPKDDWNGQFGSASAAEDLTRAYRVMFYSAGTDQEFVDAVKHATTAKPASLVLVGGHGEPTLTAFGSDDPARLPEALRKQLAQRTGNQEKLMAKLAAVNEEKYLDFSDADILSRLKDRLAKGADLVLMSCSTGKGEARGHNLANFLHKLFPQTRVHAPVEPVPNSGLVLNDDGTFARAGFADIGKAYVAGR